MSAVAIEVLLIGWETHLHYYKTKEDFFFQFTVSVAPKET